MRPILITQCLQNDFVRLLEKYDPLPNYLHVGYDEAKRLNGERAEEGPVAQIMRWAYDQSDDALKIIHIRDWHDDRDPEQAAHLRQFGSHCIKGSEGADFVFGKQIKAGRSHIIVDASGLNDFYKTDLAEHLSECSLESVSEREAPSGAAPNLSTSLRIGRAQDMPSLAAPDLSTSLRIGLIGVWTEAKITYLAYELVTRYPKIELITCSALTASSSRSQHFIALDHLRKILGLKIFDSVASFAEYLGGSGHGLAASRYAQTAILDNTKFSFNIPYELKEEDGMILHYLFRDSKSAAFVCLDGGFSGNVVLKAESRDQYAQKQTPTVVKIGERDPISRERAAFERVQEVLGNSAPAIVDFAEFGARGGIKYRYAAMIDGKVKTFQKYFAESDDTDLLIKFLQVVFTRQLGKFYEAAVQESLNLLEYYDFRPKYADSVKKKCGELATLNTQGELQIAPGLCVEDVSQFYARDLLKLRESVAVPRYVSWLHGDLNGANIMIDEAHNVWLIDFFHTHRGHALKDLIKLENDILFIFTKIDSEKDLKLATQATEYLFAIHDLALPLGEIPSALDADHRFAKSLKVISYLRTLYKDIIELDRDPYQFFVAAARYAMHTLSFDECNLWQRKWALYAGARAIAKIREALTQSAKLRIDFMAVNGAPYAEGVGAAIGLTILPGRKDRGRDLAADIAEMKQAGVTSVVTLLSNAEFSAYGVANLIEQYRAAGFDVLHTPVIDQGVPTTAQAQQILGFMKQKADAGEKLLVHCVGGLGRTGLVAALYIKKFAGLSGDAAIERVRQVRSPRAIENAEQEKFVRDYA
ncbi:MAG: dual specificity protein phosphatase family protein [Turneriella sp.]